MAYKIIWSPRAEVSFNNIIEYLDAEWSAKQIESFILQTESTIKLISKSPLLFRKSEKEDIHEALITKHNLLIYQVSKTERKIELLAFFDTEQNPKKRKFKNYFL